MVLPDVVERAGARREGLCRRVEPVPEACQPQARVEVVDAIDKQLQRRLADLGEDVQQGIGRGQRRAVEFLGEVVGACDPGAALAELTGELELLRERGLFGRVGARRKSSNHFVRH